MIYQWTLIAPGNSATAGLNDATAAQPQFDTDVAGTYMVFLQVSDGQETATDMVTITAQ